MQQTVPPDFMGLMPDQPCLSMRPKKMRPAAARPRRLDPGTGNLRGASVTLQCTSGSHTEGASFASFVGKA